MVSCVKATFTVQLMKKAFPTEAQQEREGQRRPWTPPKLERGSDVIDNIDTQKTGITEIDPIPVSTATS